MTRIPVKDYQHPGGWVDPATADQRSRECCAALEDGKILFFDGVPFDFPQADRDFLLSQKQSGFKGHKNISYRPSTDSLRGEAGGTPHDTQRLHAILRDFSKQVTAMATRVLAPYAPHWRLDFASYRPIEEQNRDLPLKRRNDLMHVDAFPTRPTHGGRILRVFTNINPDRQRVWETTEGGFDRLAERLADEAGLKRFAAAARSPGRAILRALAPALKTIGIKGIDRSPYDRFMLHFHDYLKANTDYQQKWAKERLEFPPGSAWMVFTDQVPHAALSGQYALEQTFIIPIEAMVTPERSPLRVLERRCGSPLVG